MRRRENFEKKTLDQIVTARAEKADVQALKENNVNISKLIRRAISDAAKRYR